MTNNNITKTRFYIDRSIVLITIIGIYLICMCQDTIKEMYLSMDSNGAPFSLVEILLNIFWSGNTFTPIVFTYIILLWLLINKFRAKKIGYILYWLFPIIFILYIALISYISSPDTVQYGFNLWSEGFLAAAKNSQRDMLISQVDLMRIVDKPMIDVVICTFLLLALYFYLLLLIIAFGKTKEGERYSLMLSNTGFWNDNFQK